ncbi:MAG: hypothetical protein COV66_06370 [Nitrospinae bacterium CG11_big_fil_rev_8_21_14_0_20_45_15]|nr:MAG: hypothetical protein COV66_06370 [Nitrospinae bacterium CG11_big_fil_rev_8_21_14_0_20_45_15]
MIFSFVGVNNFLTLFYFINIKQYSCHKLVWVRKMRADRLRRLQFGRFAFALIGGDTCAGIA